MVPRNGTKTSIGIFDAKQDDFNPFRAAVPVWEQTTCHLGDLLRKPGLQL